MKKIIFVNKFDEQTIGKLQNHYKISTVAGMYEISENIIRKWITQKKIKVCKIGGAVRIPKSELLKIVQDWSDYE